MSIPSKPYRAINAAAVSANAVAEAALFTVTRPVSPPTERITRLPRLCRVRTSAVKSASV
jgi:hypothetical protein